MAFLPVVRSGSPGVTADADAGFAPGAIWTDSSTEVTWVCTRSTVGNAAWSIMSMPTLPTGALARFRALRTANSSSAGPPQWGLNLPISRGPCISRGIAPEGSTPVGGLAGALISGGTIASAGSTHPQDCLSLTTGAVIGSTAYSGTSAVMGAFRHNLRGLYPVESGSTTGNVRIWIGYTSGGTMPSADTLGASLGAAYRYSTPAGDTNWMLCTSNGAAQTPTDTGCLFEATHTYMLFVGTTDAGASIEWAIDDITNPAAIVSYSGVTSSTLPGTSTYMRAITHVETRTGGARSLVMFGIESDTIYVGIT